MSGILTALIIAITDVTWAMTGASPFISKLMDAFMNMDKLVGRDFEAGLAKLKQVAEGRGFRRHRT